MRIENSGFVGIGSISNLPSSTPQSLLHLHQSTGVSLQTQFTNSNTSATTTDGFLVGIDANGNAQVMQQENLDMMFYTNGSSNERMRILSGGNVGIGTSAPNYLLHQHAAGSTSSTWHQFTTGNTGTATTDGLIIGTEYNASYTPGANSFAKFIQRENAPMKFYTGTGSGISDRMIINSNYSPNIHSVAVNTDGYVGIGLPNFWNEEATNGEGPRSLVHLQGPYNAYVNGGLGWRSWMKTGIYMNENSDEVYFGLKNEFALNGTNRSDAIIAWGDDLYSPPDIQPDNLRIILLELTETGIQAVPTLLTFHVTQD